MMKSYPFGGQQDLLAIQGFLKSLPNGTSIIDFDENIQLESVQSTLRIFRQSQEIIALAYIDDYNNLWFDTLPEFPLLDQLETEIVNWAETCMIKRNAETGQYNTLDHACSADNRHRLQLLQKHGFTPEPVRSLKYSRSVNQQHQMVPLPEGYFIRKVNGKEEVEQLVALHRAAFCTDQMTVEYRLAMMSAPQYLPEADLVAEDAFGELVAFCVCGFEDIETGIGYTDPIGIHPVHQRKGLGSAILTAGIQKLRELGAVRVELGTSSDNIAMQRLAAKLGFQLVSEKLWFSKDVNSR
ncbi:MAG TPA: GNAT family N-acetyltransferase [Anaerolineales bacterium]|nr:GNAT family N-acetyltransferase [Anaerolineales bacterium]